MSVTGVRRRIRGRRTALFGRENDGGVEQVISGGDTTGKQVVVVVEIL